MNKFISILAACMVALFAVPSLAWDAPPSPKPQSAILDQAHVLSSEAHARLDAQLTQINQSSANELAALILPSLDGQNIEDVGVATAKAWGVGKKDVDNGVLVILAMKEHKSRIETGKGVEGDLPDLKCNDILQNTLRPHMRSGDVEGGLKATFSAISTSIANHKADVASGRSSATSSDNSPLCDVQGGVGAGGDSTMSWLVPLVLLLLGTWWFVRIIARTKRRQMDAMETASREVELLQRQQDRIARLKEEQARLKHQESLKALEASMASALDNPPTRTHLTMPPIVTPQHAAEETERKRIAEAKAEEERYMRQREEDARRQRQREEDDRRRRDSESSSSSSSDWSSGGSSGGGFDGGGFGGGDFGGGGSSGDW